MKKLVVVLFMLSLTSIVYSQGCKSEKDAFTGEDVVSYYHMSRMFFYDYKDGKIYLRMQFNYDGVKKVVVPKAAKFMLKFNDNTIVSLYTITDAKPTPNVISTRNNSRYRNGRYTQNTTSQIIRTKYMYKFELTEEQLEKFVESKLTLIRYPGIEEEYLDMDFTKLFTKKYANKFKEGANCILDHMPKEK